MYNAPVACIKTVHEDYLMPRSPVFYGVTYEECKENCQISNYRYFGLECPSDAREGNYITVCFCYNNVPFSLVQIPMPNCFGEPETEIYGRGHDSCQSPENVYVDADGHGLGSWGRAAIYEITDMTVVDTTNTTTTTASAIITTNTTIGSSLRL